MALKMSPGYRKLFPLVCAVSIYCLSALCTVRGKRDQREGSF